MKKDVKSITLNGKNYPAAEFDYNNVATMEEIEANDYNLNIPRYVDTFEKEEEIDLDAKANDIAAINADIQNAEAELKKYFDELGLKFPF